MVFARTVHSLKGDEEPSCRHEFFIVAARKDVNIVANFGHVTLKVFALMRSGLHQPFICELLNLVPKKLSHLDRKSLTVGL